MDPRDHLVADNKPAPPRRFGAMANDIAKFLEADLIGKDLFVDTVSSSFAPKQNSLVFTNSLVHIEDNISSLVLCKPDCYEKSRISSSSSYIFCSNPRLAFAKAVQKFFTKDEPPSIHQTAVIADDVNIHPSVTIGAHCVIGSDVTIGEGTIIKNNVVISENVKIGDFCYLKSGSIIGEDGFGFDFEDDKRPVRLPHLGSVELGDQVEVGSNAVISRGTMNNTIIGDNVKIDDLVFIAHNVTIGNKAILTACAEVSGSVEIGECVWVGPNSSIIQKMKIGSGATIGIGTTITSDVGPGQKIMGISGLPLRKLVKLMKKITG